MKITKIITISLITLLLSCTSPEENNDQIVKNFQLDKYLGVWYEIIRLDHSFEEGCKNVSANYSKLENGEIKVSNSCTVEGKNKIAKATGKFKGDSTIGHLRVSFFWPFYSDYKIVYLDPEYQIAMIYGKSRDYLWILAREKYIDIETLNMLIRKAEKDGFDRKRMINTNHGGISWILP